ncbi:hypothetical protein PVK06_008641 [Gossypium arboreum]|uniref:RNase H type-1 domain-containing protein n=1 Tax=Gossypium arboreum TaxID=29729 RepID=A0ABR0QKF3_GOSAR|nr:hypothetical protein PVK06_008641 [Gossypium arboreum]
MVVNKNIPSAFAGEALACLQAVHLGQALGFPDVIVEGDALTVIHKGQSPLFDSSILGANIQDIKWWAGLFRRCEFRHVPRKGYIVANLLAKEGLRTGTGSYLSGRVSDFAQQN